jgi:hypothetical protein
VLGASGAIAPIGDRGYGSAVDRRVSPLCWSIVRRPRARVSDLSRVPAIRRPGSRSDLRSVSSLLTAWTIVPIGISIIMSLLLSMSDVTTPHRQRQPNRTSPPRPYAHHTTHRGVHLLTSYVTQEQTARSGTNNAPPLTSRRYRIKGGDTCTVCEEFPPPQT